MPPPPRPAHLPGIANGPAGSAEPARALHMGALNGALGFRIRLLEQTVLRSFLRHMEPHDISPAAFTIFMVVAANPLCRPQTIGGALEMHQPNVVERVAGLIERGLVARRRDPADGRAYVLELTDAGRAFLKALTPAREAHLADMRAELGDRYDRLFELTKPGGASAEAAKLSTAELEGALGYRLRLIEQTIMRSFARSMDQLEISPTLYSILLLIEANGACRQSDLSHALRMHQSNLVERVGLLMRRGLLVRRADPADGRANVLELSLAGRQFMGELHAAHDAHIAELHELFGADRYAALMQLCEPAPPR